MRLHTAAKLISIIALSLTMGVACGNNEENNTPTPPKPDMPSADMNKDDMGGDMQEDQSPDLMEVGTGYDARPLNATCKAVARPREATQVKLTRVFENVTLRRPIELVQAPGEAGQWFVVEQGGRIIRIDAASGQSDVAINLSQQLTSGGERGLLGLAFHPQWAQNQKVYVSYTYDHPRDGLKSRISQIAVNPQNWSMSADNEKVIIEVAQPYNNHNGGQIAFGPDGMLYIAMGDGGSAGDPLNSGQDTSTLLGNILRVDVDGGDPYAIPSDNPFANKTDQGKPEIYAWGLRNPWKMSFDRETGTLWSGDVGQGEREEVNIIERGGNYGWKVREGDLCYRNNPDCDKPFVEPVVVYDHGQGKSITGGYVYRGNALPTLVGKYLFADYVSGRLWAVFYNSQDGEPEARVLLSSSGFQISSFGQNQDTGEVYLLDYDARNDRGAGIYRIDPQEQMQGNDPFPQKLSETGCVNPQNIKQTVEGAIPYVVAEPFWSDNAKKTRYVALPDNTQITHNMDGSFAYPNGTVFIKHFDLQGKRIETRLFMKHDDGFWAGYTYEWLDDQSDAILVRGDKRKQIGNQTWIYPSRAQCLSCHNSAANDVLGFVTEQLQGKAAYPGDKLAPQRATLDHINLFDRPLGESMNAFVPTRDTQEDLNKRAKVYMDVNCAYCHRPDGVARGELDLRFATPLGQMGLCDKNPQLGTLDIPNAKLLAPGDPSSSIVLERIKRRDRHGMPPIGSTIVDDHGVMLLTQWISGLPSCP